MDRKLYTDRVITPYTHKDLYRFNINMMLRLKAYCFVALHIAMLHIVHITVNSKLRINKSSILRDDSIVPYVIICH